MAQDHDGVRGGASDKEARSHSHGFELALDRALEKAGDLGSGTFDVIVQQEATVTVTNPGNIIEYSVTLKRKDSSG
jgi:hypothetical protein